MVQYVTVLVIIILCVSCCRITFSGLTCTDMYVGWYEASMSATQHLTVIMSTLLGLISSSMILRDRGGGMMEGQDLSGSHMLCFGPENIFILLEI